MDFHTIVMVIYQILIDMYTVGELFAHVRKKQPWADPKVVKVSINWEISETEFSSVHVIIHLFSLSSNLGNFCLQKMIDAKLYALLGERTAADNEKPTKKKKEKPVKAEVITIWFFLGYVYFRVNFWLFCLATLLKTRMLVIMPNVVCNTFASTSFMSAGENSCWRDSSR